MSTVAKADASDGKLVTGAGQATRFVKKTNPRYDLLDPDFIEAMAIIMGIGAEKYGEENWKKGLKGAHGGVNHAFAHLVEYQQGVPNDYGPDEMHMAQVGVNAMFEHFFKKKQRKEIESMSHATPVPTTRKEREKQARRLIRFGKDTLKALAKERKELKKGTFFERVLNAPPIRKRNKK